MTAGRATGLAKDVRARAAQQVVWRLRCGEYRARTRGGDVDDAVTIDGDVAEHHCGCETGARAARCAGVGAPSTKAVTLESAQSDVD